MEHATSVEINIEFNNSKATSFAHGSPSTPLQLSVPSPPMTSTTLLMQPFVDDMLSYPLHR
jgi:hypothetical protein